MLSKLYISPSTPLETLNTLSDLVSEAADSKLAAETASRNAVNKLQTAISKIIASASDESPEKVVESVEQAETPPAVKSDKEDDGDITATDAEVGADELDSQLGEADAEGTILMSDEEDDTVHVIDTKAGSSKAGSRRRTDESLLDSLLDEDGDTIMG